MNKGFFVRPGKSRYVLMNKGFFNFNLGTNLPKAGKLYPDAECRGYGITRTEQAEK